MEKALPVELAEMIIEASSKKTELLRRYADESPKCFRLFDGWLRGKHWLLAGLTWELMEGAHVRVLIPTDIGPDDAVRLLRKIADLIERDGLDWLDRFAQEDCPF